MPRTTGRVHWKYWHRAERRKVTRKRYPSWAAARGWTPRAYGDFRDFSHVGGGIEALIPPGDQRATPDPEIAEKLVADRLVELQEAKRRKIILGAPPTCHLDEFVAEHLEAKEREGLSTRWLVQAERHLAVAMEFFGTDQSLDEVRPSEVRAYVEHLKGKPNGRGGTLANASVRKYLNSLSNLFRRAVSEELVASNPVAALLHKPTPERTEARWLEPHDAALLLEAARLCSADPGSNPIPFGYALVGTFLLTGGRKSEVLGLEVVDVSFDRRTVTFRPNQHRGLKTRTSHRVVPLWPQLEEILRTHVFGRGEPLGDLLFPSPRSNGDQMIRDLRKMLDRVGELADFEAGSIRTKIFRHTYCAARLQTLDRGVPVAPFTAARELGHSSTTMVEKVYSDLGRVRHRSEVVEYCVDRFQGTLGDRLKSLYSIVGDRVREY